MQPSPQARDGGVKGLLNPSSKTRCSCHWEREEQLGRVVLLVLHFSRKGGNIAHRKIAVGTKPAWFRLDTTVWQIQPAYSGCSCLLQLLPPKPVILLDWTSIGV